MNNGFSDPTPDASNEALVGDPEKVEILVVDCDPEGSRHFELERANITAALGERALARARCSSPGYDQSASVAS